jgi:hypothetical protein
MGCGFYDYKGSKSANGYVMSSMRTSSGDVLPPRHPLPNSLNLCTTRANSRIKGRFIKGARHVEYANVLWRCTSTETSPSELNSTVSGTCQPST